MAYLLDAHAMIWWWTNSPKLGDNARRVIMAAESRIAVSAVGVWEIAIKSKHGRLPEIEDFRADYPALMARDGFERLDIREDHAVHAAYLDSGHRDPFDRLLAAQALIEDLTVITRDREIAKFGCKVLW